MTRLQVQRNKVIEGEVAAIAHKKALYGQGVSNSCKVDSWPASVYCDTDHVTLPQVPNIHMYIMLLHSSIVVRRLVFDAVAAHCRC